MRRIWATRGELAAWDSPPHVHGFSTQGVLLLEPGPRDTGRRAACSQRSELSPLGLGAPAEPRYFPSQARRSFRNGCTCLRGRRRQAL